MDTHQPALAIAAIKPSAYAGTPDFLKALLEKGDELSLDMSSIKTALVSGGAGCSDQLKALEEICRNRLRATASLQAGAGAARPLAAAADAVQLRRMSPSQAILHLGSTDRSHTEKQQGDPRQLRPVDRDAAFLSACRVWEAHLGCASADLQA